MSTRYFTHFVTTDDAQHHGREWSGIVELDRPIEEPKRGKRELRAALAANFDLETEQVRILNWARLH